MGRKESILFWSFMDGWEFWGNWKRRKFACEEGKNMVSITYLVEGSGALNNEMLRGWLVESHTPHLVAVNARGRRNYTMN